MTPEHTALLCSAASRRIGEVVQGNLAPRTKRNPFEWAQVERYIARGQSPLSTSGDIRFDARRMPWTIEPMIEAVNPQVQVTVLWFASGMGKTEGVSMSVIGHSVCEDPGNQFIVFPKEESRDKFSRDVVERTIDATPAMNSTFVPRTSRDMGRSIGYKRFKGGSMYLTSAGSAANFRGPRAKLVYCGEIDGYPDNVDGEGDPISLAFRRAEGFSNSVKILEGTGTHTPTLDDKGKTIYRSRIHEWFDRSDQRRWFCPCQFCGFLQTMEFAQIRYPAGHPEDARYHCSQCDEPHTDEQRVAMVHAGRWYPTAGLTQDQIRDIANTHHLAKFTGVRGYHIRAWATTLPAEKGYTTKLHQFAVESERMQASREGKKVWTNTYDAWLINPDEEAEDPPSWKPLFDRRENWRSVPAAVGLMTAGIDVQKNRLEITRLGFNEVEETWILEHTILPGEVQDRGVWHDLETELLRTLDHESGGKIGLSMAFIDASKWPDWVMYFLGYLKEKGSPLRGRVRACRGSSVFPHPLVDSRYSRLAKKLFGHWVGTDEAKDLIYTRLRREPDGDETPEGWVHFPVTCDEMYFHQLVAERVTIQFVRGEEVRKYKNEDHVRNEALDCFVYGLAAKRVKRWDWAELRAAIAPEKVSQDPEPKRETAAVVRRSSFVGGFGGRW